MEPKSGPKLNKPFPNPNNGSDKMVGIGQLVSEIFKFKSVHASTHAHTDAGSTIYYTIHTE